MERQDRIELYKALEVREVEARAQHSDDWMLRLSVEISSGVYYPY